MGKIAVKNFRSARGERENINLRPKTHQNDKMGEQTRARQSKHPVCLERRAESSCTELRLQGPKCKAVLKRWLTLTWKQKKHPTYVKGVLSSTLPIHSIHQIAGQRLEEETEDGHADTETLRITDEVV